MKTKEQMDAETREVVEQFKRILLATPGVKTRIDGVQTILETLVVPGAPPEVAELNRLLVMFASLGIAVMMSELRKAAEDN